MAASTDGCTVEPGLRVQPGQGRDRLHLGSAVPEGPPGHQAEGVGASGDADRRRRRLGRRPPAVRGGRPVAGISGPAPRTRLPAASATVGPPPARRSRTPRAGSGRRPGRRARVQHGRGATAWSSAEEIPGSAMGSSGLGVRSGPARPIERARRRRRGPASRPASRGSRPDAGATPGRSRPRCRRGSRSPRSTPEPGGQLAGDHPIRPGHRRAVTSWLSQVIRSSRLVKVPAPLGPGGRRQHHVGRPDGRGQVGVDRDDEPGAEHGPHASWASGKSATGVGAEQHQTADAAPAGGLQDPGGRARPGAGRASAPVVLVPGPTGVERRPGRAAHPGARPMSRAPCTLARRKAGEKSHAGQAGQYGGCRRHLLLGLGQRRAAQDAPRPRAPSGPLFSLALEM